MTTKHFCSRCTVRLERPTWLVNLHQVGTYGEEELLCEACKRALENWLAQKMAKMMVTDEQIIKVLELTSFPSNLGPSDTITEARKILEDGGIVVRLDTDERNERSRRVLYHINNLKCHSEDLRRVLVKERLIVEPIQTPQEELVDVPVVRTVRDEGKGSAVQGEEDPS